MGVVFATFPYILNDMEDFIGKYNGGQIDSRLDKVKDMVGATASQAGEDGLVPAPAKGDEGRFLCGDGTWKDVVVKPDYTVFDILTDIINSNSFSISQENYNALLSKFIENQYMYTFPIRDNGFSIVSLAGLADSDGTITLIVQQETGIGSITRLQLDIKPDLTFSPLTGMVAFDATNNTGIDIYVSQGDTKEVKNKTITLHTTGDGTKALMDDGKYRKLPVYGRNLLLGSGKEVSNSSYEMVSYWLSEQIPKGTQVTLTIWGELGNDRDFIRVYNSGGRVHINQDYKSDDFVNGKASKTFNWVVNNEEDIANNTFLRFYQFPNGATSTSTIHKIKLEYGDISTEWTPAWEDIPDIEERYAYGAEWDMASSSY